MRMTWNLANTLMDSLCCLAISATVTAKGTPYPDPRNLPDDVMELVETYARAKFQEICDEFEYTFGGEEWEIEESEDDKGDE